MKSPLVIATRGSALALWQANYVKGLLKDKGAEATLDVIKTTGDKVQDRFLHEIGGKGTFIKELEEALKAKTADLAVHSLKDMTARLDPFFSLAAVLKRHSPADVMIFRDDVYAKHNPPPVLAASDVKKLGKLRIGTGSLRRQALLKREAPELTTEGVRGNVDTRIRKLKEGSWDALILAEASLERLGIKDVKACRLDPEWFVPCASQGALAIESRTEDPLREWLRPLGHLETTAAVTIERNLLARLGGDCTMPFGCLVTTDGKAWTARALILTLDGEAAEARLVMPAPAFSTKKFSDELAHRLAEGGAGKILAKLKIPVPAEFA